MTEQKDRRFYIRRQTNAGPNQGKWRVHAPEGWSVALGENKQQALAIAAAFTLAAKDPEHGEYVGYSSTQVIEAGGYAGYTSQEQQCVYPRWKR